MGREVGFPGGTVNKNKLKKFRPSTGVPNFEQRAKRLMYLADGGLADAQRSPAQNTALTAAQNVGLSPMSSPATMDSESRSLTPYPTPLPAPGQAQTTPTASNLALAPMNLSQPARVAKGGKVKMAGGGKVRGGGLATKGVGRGRMV